MLITALVLCLMRGRKGAKAPGVWSGWPVCGLRAWRWRMEAPASAAATASRAISSGVIGRCGDMVGVWIAPVTAQVMMTFRFAAMPLPPAEILATLVSDLRLGRALVGGQRHQAPVAPGGSLAELARLEPRTALRLDGLEHRPAPLGAPLLGLEEPVIERAI